MKTHAFIVVALNLMFSSSHMVFGDTTQVIEPSPKRAILDPRTKITYYLESDLRHIAALSPDGRLLWCCEVVPASASPRVHIISFGLYLTDDNLIGITSNPAGPAWGVINKKSGVYTLLGED